MLDEARRRTSELLNVNNERSTQECGRFVATTISANIVVSFASVCESSSAKARMSFLLTLDLSFVRVLWAMPEGWAAFARWMHCLSAAFGTAAASAEKRNGRQTNKWSFSLVGFKVDLNSPQLMQKSGFPFSASTSVFSMAAVNHKIS